METCAVRSQFGHTHTHTSRFSRLIWTLKCHLLRFSRSTVQFFRSLSLSLSIAQLFLLCLAFNDNTVYACCAVLWHIPINPIVHDYYSFFFVVILNPSHRLLSRSLIRVVCAYCVYFWSHKIFYFFYMSWLYLFTIWMLDSSRERNQSEVLALLSVLVR